MGTTPLETRFFLTQFTRGLTIHGITLERSADEDDDWITIRFDGPDPAISPFV